MYKYFSPEIAREYDDIETGEKHSNVLVGGGFTNRPVFKRMEALKYSEQATSTPTDSKNILFYFDDDTIMKELMMMLQKLLAQDAVTAEEYAACEKLYNEQGGAEIPEAAEMFSALTEKM